MLPGHMCSPLTSQPGQPLLADAFLNPWQVDFTAGQWPDDMQCSRASSAAITRPSGLLDMLTANTPRLDFDPVRQQQRGLLIEGSRTNLALHSRDLGQSVWVKTNCTATLNHVGIDGAPASASLLTATTNGATCLQAVASSNGSHSFSLYIKRLNGTGTLELTTNGGTTWTTVVPTATWQRFTLPAQTLANPNFGIRLGTAGDSIAVDGCQNEPGPFASSVIFTTTATATRAADICQLGTLGLIGHIHGSGTLVAEFEFMGTASSQSAVFLTNGLTNRIGFRRGNMTPSIFVPVAETSGNSLTNSFYGGSFPSLPAEAIHTAAISYETDNFSACLNGGDIARDTSGNPSLGLDRLHVGRSSAANSDMFGWVRRVAYIPAALSPGYVQALSLHR